LKSARSFFAPLFSLWLRDIRLFFLSSCPFKATLRWPPFLFPSPRLGAPPLSKRGRSRDDEVGGYKLVGTARHLSFFFSLSSRTRFLRDDLLPVIRQWDASSNLFTLPFFFPPCPGAFPLFSFFFPDIPPRQALRLLFRPSVPWAFPFFFSRISGPLVRPTLIFPFPSILNPPTRQTKHGIFVFPLNFFIHREFFALFLQL